MSVKVTIEQYPHGSFSREILISRVSDLGLEQTPDGRDIADLEFLYEVEYRPGSSLGGRTLFFHRYGDPLTTLVTKAIAELELNGLIEKPQQARVAE